ncbi:MAG: hypothetical protein IK015_10950 [Treponema sp.]|nr:hypothetical protein [Treponema sp.]
MGKTIAWRAFSKFLHDKGYSDVTKRGNPSTTYDYPSRINRICEREKFSNWDDFGEHIFEIFEKYSPNGAEAEYGNQSNGSNLKALELFKDFYDSLN